MKAKLSTTRISPRKANLLAHMIRTRSADQALEILKYTPKKAAKILHKLLASAVANAVNNYKQDQKSLFVKQVIVNKGPTLKRSVPVSRGRAYPILKRTSHITLELGLNTAANSEKNSKGKSAEPVKTGSVKTNAPAGPAKAVAAKASVKKAAPVKEKKTATKKSTK